MTTVFTIIGGAIACFVAIVLLGCFVFTVQYIWLYKFHKCPHCGHRSQFKGFKEDDNNGHFLFYCTKCRAWETIAKEDFFRDSEGHEYGKAGNS